MFGIFLIFVVQSFATGYLPQSRPLAGHKTLPPGHEAAERESFNVLLFHLNLYFL